MLRMWEILCPSSLVPLLQCCSRIGLRRTSNFFNGVVRRKSGSDFSMGHLQIFKEQRRGIIFIRTNPLSSSSSLIPPMSIHSSFPVWKFLKFERFQFWEYNCVIFLVFGFYSQKLKPFSKYMQPISLMIRGMVVSQRRQTL